MNKTKLHSMKYNFAMNFILTATQFVFPLITFPYVSRVLGAIGNGKVSFAVSVANYFMMVASLGIPTYGIRACARVRDDNKELSKTVKELFFINLIMTILVSITFLICVFTVPLFREDKTLFLINGLNIVLNMFGMNWLFQALEQYDYITFRSIAFKIASIVLMFALVHNQDDYVVYGAITVFATVGSYIFNFYRLKSIVDFRFDRSENYNLRQHIRPILILFSQSLAVSIYTNLDTVMLGFMKEKVDVGYYTVAVKIKMLLLSLVSSMGSVLLPRMSYFIKQNRYDEFKKYMVKALNFSLLLSLPLSVYFVICSRSTILLLAGDGYSGAILAMQFITVAVIPNGLTGILGVQVLTALEKEKYVLASVIVGAIVDFLLNLWLIPLYGAAGASFATMIAEFCVLFVQVYYIRDLLIEISAGFRFSKYCILTIISMGTILIINNFRIESNFLYLLITAFVSFGIYGIGLMIEKDDLVYLEVKRILNKVKK